MWQFNSLLHNIHLWSTNRTFDRSPWEQAEIHDEKSDKVTVCVDIVNTSYTGTSSSITGRMRCVDNVLTSSWRQHFRRRSRRRYAGDQFALPSSLGRHRRRSDAGRRGRLRLRCGTRCAARREVAASDACTSSCRRSQRSVENRRRTRIPRAAEGRKPASPVVCT